jgi:hypothetical protein
MRNRLEEPAAPEAHPARVARRRRHMPAAKGKGIAPDPEEADRVPAGAFGFRPGLTPSEARRRARARSLRKEEEEGRQGFGRTGFPNGRDSKASTFGKGPAAGRSELASMRKLRTGRKAAGCASRHEGPAAEGDRGSPRFSRRSRRGRGRIGAWLRFGRVLAGRRVGLRSILPTAKAIREAGLPAEGAPGGEDRALASGSNRPTGKPGTWFPAEPGDGDEEGSAPFPQRRPLRSGRRAPRERTLPSFENGSRASRPRPCRAPAGNRPGLHGLDGTRGDRRRRSPSRGAHPPSG